MGPPQGERAESRRRAAERRYAELEVLRLRLASGEKLTRGDLDEATLRLAEAEQRAVAAEASARNAHLDAATAHQSAAVVNEGAGHLAEAQAHRRAAEHDLAESGEAGR